MKIFIRELHAVVLLIHIFEQSGGPGAKLSGDGPAAAVDALVDRAVADVEIEAVLGGEIIVRARPPVFALDYTCQINRRFPAVTVDAVAVQRRLDEPDVVERIRSVHVGLNL